MKRIVAVVAGLVLVGAMAMAQEFDSPVKFGNDVRLDTGSRLIDKAGTTLTSTFAQLNQGVASGVSNDAFTNAVWQIMSNMTGSAVTFTFATNLTVGGIMYACDGMISSNTVVWKTNGTVAGILYLADGFVSSNAATFKTNVTIAGNGYIADTLTATGGVVALSDFTVGGNTYLGGNASITGTETVVGMAALNNLFVKTNAVIAGTLTVTNTASLIGAVTFTAAPVLNGAQGTKGTVSALMTNAPASTTADAMWFPVAHNGTNYWIAAWPQ
jgi:hypothetical protein